uniref:Uncharacterized protein n=1 Tax=Brassica oleracea var. oleracea TaxID=109376 RepID=A0A0D3A1A4_BRAOL
MVEMVGVVGMVEMVEIVGIVELSSLLASLVSLSFAMFATLSLDSAFFHACGVSFGALVPFIKKVVALRWHGCLVELRPLLTGLTLNVIMRMMTGKRFCEEDEGGKEKISLEFQELVAEILELSSADNPADFLPALQWYDYKDYIKRAKKVGEKMDSLLQGFLDEHRANKGRLEFTNTMIAHLLDSQEKEPHYYNDVTIKGLILVCISRPY